MFLISYIKEVITYIKQILIGKIIFNLRKERHYFEGLEEIKSAKASSTFQMA
jgi:hypothetical protein